MYELSKEVKFVENIVMHNITMMTLDHHHHKHIIISYIDHFTLAERFLKHCAICGLISSQN